MPKPEHLPAPISIPVCNPPIQSGKRAALRGFAGCLGLLLALSSQAAVSPEQAQRLGKDLTDLGAERDGNPAGSIPPWHPSSTSASTSDYLQERPLLIITADNWVEHKQHLTAGQIALFQRYPTSFRMPVYRSHRDFAPPQRVQEATRKNAVQVSLSDGGLSIEGGGGGIPFPIPQNGLEAIWNHLLRWRGVGMKAVTNEAVVEANGRHSLILGRQEVLFNYYLPEDQRKDRLLLSYISLALAPPSQAGGALLLIDNLNQSRYPRQAWGYNAGERRVRRIPLVAHDSPALMAQSLRTTDDTDMFSGSPERYDWTLVGKREIYIPYHNDRVNTAANQLTELLSPHHLNPEFCRYELHRVWVVDARLKAGQRHIYGRRTFYLDEDSWSIAIADQYGLNGELSRVSVSFLLHLYDQESVLFTAAEVFHDLPSGRYHAQVLPSDTRPPVLILKDPWPQSHFTPATLRQEGIR